MKSCAWATIVLAVLFPVAAGAAGPSFNCKYAKKPAERAVCHDAELSALDLELAGLNNRAKLELAPGDGRAVKKEQRDWLLDRNACGASFGCLENSYRERIHELHAWLHG
jgi:uncharacterized protein